MDLWKEWWPRRHPNRPRRRGVFASIAVALVALVALGAPAAMATYNPTVSVTVDAPSKCFPAGTEEVSFGYTITNGTVPQGANVSLKDTTRGWVIGPNASIEEVLPSGGTFSSIETRR
ncbi:hypothetical protein IPL68_03735 [Candidatus Saccharibacteria bacterium]|nr:MAG: hypothetical protein IPL68_03735 [Candidatus Saccharibacteria bacterium]